MANAAELQRKLGQAVLQNKRVGAYCALILVCSLLSLPEDYKIDKRNILNQWFVKLGWFWTTTLITPLLFATIRSEDRETVSQTILRLILSSALWWTSVNIFQYIDTSTGFDISGHTFLLMFSSLIITSELQIHDQRSRSVETKSNSNEQQLFKLKIPLLLLRLLWDFMLLQTALYYHTILQKAIAMAWALGSWFVLHLFFYYQPPTTATAQIRTKREPKNRGFGDR